MKARTKVMTIYNSTANIVAISMNANVKNVLLGVKHVITAKAPTISNTNAVKRFMQSLRLILSVMIQMTLMTNGSWLLILMKME